MQQKAYLGEAQGQTSGGVPIRGGLQGIEFPAFRGCSGTSARIEPSLCCPCKQRGVS